MFKGICKTITAIAVMLLVVNCGSSSKEAANDLISQAQLAIQEQRYSEAIELLDTLNVRYPEQTEARRTGLGIRASAMEGIAIDSIQVVDTQLAQATLDVSNLENKFTHIAAAAAGMTGYYVPKTASRNIMSKTGIQARVTDDGYMYVVANVQGQEIGLKAIRLVAGTSQCESTALSDTRIVRVRGSESASFRQEEVADFYVWLTENQNANKIVLVGNRRNIDVNMSSVLRAEILDCAAYANALQAKRSATIRRERFERMLSTARNQIANLVQHQAE